MYLISSQVIPDNLELNCKEKTGKDHYAFTYIYTNMHPAKEYKNYMLPGTFNPSTQRQVGL